MRTVMTIAGSDSSAGAGIQADLKTFAALGVYGTSVITAITAQNTQGVQRVEDVSPDVVAAQIDAVVSDIGADVVKTGMLPNTAIIEVVVEKVREYGLTELVVDPVMRATGGDSLMAMEAVTVIRERLLPMALVFTPNLFEASALVGQEVTGLDGMRWAAKEIVGMGARNVVVKGGHLNGPAIDVFYDGRDYREFAAPRVDTINTHGTGCTFASAIAGFLAKGLDVRQAVAAAKAYVTKALQNSYPLGQGNGPVHHFFRYWQDIRR